MYDSQLIDDMLEEGIITQNDLRWEICDRCSGNGILGGYPGVYTQDDFSSGEVDYEDYMAYKRCCEDCKGLGKVHTINEIKEDTPEVREYLADYHEYMMERQAEMRWGY